MPLYWQYERIRRQDLTRHILAGRMHQALKVCFTSDDWNYFRWLQSYLLRR